jgi:DNA-binding PadR family transcriptional regulator
MVRTKDPLSPLTEATFYILISLIEPLHGYGILQKVEEMSSGRVQLGAGTLYGALKNLVEHGMIQEVGKNTGRRKNYQITPSGKALIEEELIRLAELLENGKKIMEGEVQ